MSQATYKTPSQTKSAYQDSTFYPKRSYNFAHMQRSTQLSQTDKRIEQIKRKYDTPNRKQRLSQLSAKKNDYLLSSNNKENHENYGTANFRTKSFIMNREGDSLNEVKHSSQALKQSKAMNMARPSILNNTSLNSGKDLLKGSTASSNYRERDMHILGSKLYKNQNEEQFFKRVKQMKQSLLYAENGATMKNGDSNGLGKHQIRQSRATSGFYDSTQNVQKDRIDNIDKINQKIKGILECLNESQKVRMSSKYSDLNQKRSRVDTQISAEQQLVKHKNPIRTPAENILNPSVLGRTSFGNHRYEKSQLLEKIQISRNSNQFKRNAKNDNQDQKWQKLSSKLQKYQAQNKLRLQKALQTSKVAQVQQMNNSKANQIIRKSYIQSSYTKTNDLIKRDNNKSADVKDVRSRSFISPHLTRENRQRDRSLHVRDPNGSKQYEMKSGKKLGDEITRIQRKIQQFEEEKKKLNINFKPFNYSNTKSTSNLAEVRAPQNTLKYEYSEKKISEFTRSLYKNDNNQVQKGKSLYRQQKSEKESTFRQKKSINRQKQQYSFEQKNSQTEDRLMTRQIQIKLQKSNPSSVRTSKFISQGSSRVSNYNEQQQQSYAVQHSTKQQIQQQQKQNHSKLHLPSQEAYFYSSYKSKQDKKKQEQEKNRNQAFLQLKKQTINQGIEERRKRLLQIQENYNKKDQTQNSRNRRTEENELKKFVNGLCQQVKLDEEFRNAKIWYEYCSEKNKEEKMQQLMPQLNIETIREVLKVRESENNPFFTVQGYDSSLEKVAELYKLSQNHWIQKIHQNFDKNQLQKQGFTEREIDLDKKDHINLGDLVRFLNLQSGTFYRNRDLALIFIRISKENQSSTYTELSFQQLVRSFCH